MLGDRIKIARELAGLTQDELGRAVGTTQPGVASLESGRYRPSQEYLAKIAEATGFEASFFEKEDLPQLPAGSILYRTLASVKPAVKNRAHAFCLVSFELVETLGKRLKTIPLNLPRCIDDDPVTCARITRASLGLSPNAPVKGLIRLLEKNGVVVFLLPVEAEGFDGFSTWANGRPVIALLQGKIGYRTVFTLGEELAHLVMHAPLRVSTKEADEQARAFAREFFLPHEAMELEMARPVTLTSLLEMKTRWGVSVQFLAKTAEAYGYLTRNQYRYILQQIHWRGWKYQEPGDEAILPESPRLLRTMAEMLYGVPINLSKLSRESGLKKSMLRQILGLEAAEVVQFRPRPA
jgi:Zn-dependent peptidase ImmA (M78 family)/transcriptional regulator with XRE-family HTH domain